MSARSFEGTLLLSRRDVSALLTPEDALVAVHQAFRLLGEGQVPSPAIVGVPVREGAFHIKAGLFGVGRPYFVSKTNANFRYNRERFGLPTILGTVLVCDAGNGYPLALLDSIAITVRRTAAATALATEHLARHDATTLAVIGCGTQGLAHIEAISRVRAIHRVILHDVDPARARTLAGVVRDRLDIATEVADSAPTAVAACDICVTCTPSRRFLLDASAVRPGTFVAGVGTDAEDKRELAPSLLAAGTLVVDLLSQYVAIGDLHHALDAGVLTPADVYAELGEIVAGQRQGRTSDTEIVVFDSTGMALQDAATAALVYERAVSAGLGSWFDFAA
jgi:ornithine cyclodeaminase/alanine dehydrogenase-like protein (mu-crystallin family)